MSIQTLVDKIFFVVREKKILVVEVSQNKKVFEHIRTIRIPTQSVENIFFNLKTTLQVKNFQLRLWSKKIRPVVSENEQNDSSNESFLRIHSGNCGLPEL